MHKARHSARCTCYSMVVCVLHLLYAVCGAYAVVTSYICISDPSPQPMHFISSSTTQLRRRAGCKKAHVCMTTTLRSFRRRLAAGRDIPTMAGRRLQDKSQTQCGLCCVWSYWPTISVTTRVYLKERKGVCLIKMTLDLYCPNSNAMKYKKKMVSASDNHTPYAPLVRYISHTNAA